MQARRGNQSAPLNLLLFDVAGESPTSALLQAAATRLASDTGEPFEVTNVGPSSAISALPTNLDGSLAFVGVCEAELSLRAEQRHVPAPSLALAYSLLRKHPSATVYLLSPGPPTSFTGLDSIGALLAGIAGIVDDRLLLTRATWDAILSHRPVQSRNRALLLVGRSSSSLLETRSLVDEWAVDDHGRNTLEIKCFKAAVALAQLDRLKPLVGQPQPFSFHKLAQSLNLMESLTGFRLAEVDLRKVISVLANRVLKPNHPAAARAHMPSELRRLGFPAAPPAFLNLDTREAISRLYAALHETLVSQAPSSSPAVPIAMGLLPLRTFQRLSRPQ